jgi:uncharacterized membrane protein|tara:strand:+ start:116 stop:310 length:195 start_codon:yes stop_codon:yes gene_type:complete
MGIFKIVLLSLFMTLMVVVSSVSGWVFVTNGLDPFTQFIGAMLMVLAFLISWLAFYIVNATSGL